MLGEKQATKRESKIYLVASSLRKDLKMKIGLQFVSSLGLGRAACFDSEEGILVSLYYWGKLPLTCKMALMAHELWHVVQEVGGRTFCPVWILILIAAVIVLQPVAIFMTIGLLYVGLRCEMSERWAEKNAKGFTVLLFGKTVVNELSRIVREE